MKWFKRYLIGCMVALGVCAGIDGHRNPRGDIHIGTIVVASIGWPVLSAIIVGGTVGELYNDYQQGKFPG